MSLDTEPRIASLVTGSGFPYTVRTICYVAVWGDGRVTNPHGRDEIVKAALAQSNSYARLYAAWPGRFQSDLFFIDRVEELLEAFGSVPEPKPDTQTLLTRSAPTPLSDEA